MKKPLLIVSVLVLLLVTGAYGLYTSVWTGAAIKKIVISSPFPIRYDTQEIAGKKMFFINIQSVRAHILQKNTAIKTVFIEKKYPDTLEITVIARTPIAQLVPSTLPRYIDEDGVVLTQATAAATLPVIEVWNIPVYWNEKPDWRMMKAVMYVQLFGKEQIALHRISMAQEGSYYTLLLDQQVVVSAPYAANPGSLVASLQVILSRFRIEEKRIAAVDFRFDKPVVTFQTGEKISPL